MSHLIKICAICQFTCFRLRYFSASLNVNVCNKTVMGKSQQATDMPHLLTDAIREAEQSQTPGQRRLNERRRPPSGHTNRKRRHPRGANRKQITHIDILVCWLAGRFSVQRLFATVFLSQYQIVFKKRNNGDQ